MTITILNINKFNMYNLNQYRINLIILIYKNNYDVKVNSYLTS